MSCSCGKDPCVYQADTDAVIRAEQAFERDHPELFPPPKPARITRPRRPPRAPRALRRPDVPFYCRKKHGKTRGVRVGFNNQNPTNGDHICCRACLSESQQRYKAKRATMRGVPKQEVAAGS